MHDVQTPCMKPYPNLLLPALAIALCFAWPFAPAATVNSKPVPLIEGLGAHVRKITTSSPEAQRYFNQGLNFLFGFNHTMAIRSFQEAARLDPACAMAHW